MKHLSSALLIIGAVAVMAGASLGQSRSREDLLRELQAKRGDLQQLEEQFLAPSPDDQTALAAFLSQPDTGLVRLLPRELYDSEVYKQNKKTLSIRGGGAYYSFTRRTHEYGFGSDLELQGNAFSVGFAGADYGMMVNLGDVSLDEVNLDHPRAGFMVSYRPSPEEAVARSEFRKFRQGFTDGGVEYRRSLPVVVDNSYLLRSINYSESDVLVAFRVVRKDSDGSVVIAWKLLKKYPMLALARSN